MRALDVQNVTNFFEKRVAEYAKTNVGEPVSNAELNFNSEF